MSKQRKRRQRPRKNRITEPETQVDIVMPVYGQPEFLLACLASFFDHDPGISYTLNLVDDQSPETHRLAPILDYAQEKGARVVKHRRNKGFAATCNTGAALGSAPWILLLNTDTLILNDGWLKAMVDAGRNPRVAVVGALLTFFETATDWAPASPIRPAGKVQHAGVVFDILGRPYHIFVGWDPDHPKVNQTREMNCVTGACFLTRRHAWRRIGGLDEDYTRGNFEDVNYCLIARTLGYKVVFTPEVHLSHYAGGSGNSMTADRNARLFQLKAGHLVVYDEWRFWQQRQNAR